MPNLSEPAEGNPDSIAPKDLGDLLNGETVEFIEFEEDPAADSPCQRLRITTELGLVVQLDTWAEPDDSRTKSGFDAWIVEPEVL